MPLSDDTKYKVRITTMIAPVTPSASALPTAATPVEDAAAEVRVADRALDVLEDLVEGQPGTASSTLLTISPFWKPSMSCGTISCAKARAIVVCRPRQSEG